MNRTKRQPIPAKATVAFAREPRETISPVAVYTLPRRKAAQAKHVSRPLPPLPPRPRLLDQVLAACRKGSVAARRWLRWLQARRQAQLAAKRLRMCETLSLGEKRFVAIVQVDGQQFLLAGAAGNVSLLAQLNSEPRFATVLRESDGPQRTQE